MKRSVRVLLSLAVSFATTAAFAQTRTFHDWSVIVSDDKEDLIALTSVDSDKFLAYRCFRTTGKCIHVFTLAAECENGKTYPVLVNSNYSALAMDCTCSKNGNSYEFIPSYTEFHNILINSKGHIGFALPMVSGHFKVVRFSLAGVRDAMTLAERVTVKDSAEYQ